MESAKVNDGPCVIEVAHVPGTTAKLQAVTRAAVQKDVFILNWNNTGTKVCNKVKVKV